MDPEFILMLTYNDETVKNALELFYECKNLPVTHWGFKDVGLPQQEMTTLVAEMKNAGKTTYLEVVSLTEAEGLKGAVLAVNAGFDVLMGTVFFDSINDYLKDKSVKYYPFPGYVHSHPSILDGTMDEIVAHAKFLEEKGADGLDLLTYRFTGDAPKLLKMVVENCSVPIVSAGSIDTFEKIREVKDSKAWGFTIGSALFEKKFDPDGTFIDNINHVTDWLYNQSR